MVSKEKVHFSIHERVERNKMDIPQIVGVNRTPGCFPNHQIDILSELNLDIETLKAEKRHEDHEHERIAGGQYVNIFSKNGS